MFVYASVVILNKSIWDNNNNNNLFQNK
jgi:hypothetical protein